MTSNKLVSHVNDTLANTGKALTSVCTAQPEVLEAALMLAHENDRDLLIEATSNQVNHYGGYTGLKPVEFIADVHERISRLGISRERVFFGGDHLGPQAWKHLSPRAAMREAETMVRDYVEAGFIKIHLDCSEGCAGEPAQLDDATVARRAASLVETCECFAPDPNALVYVVGTEVPPPGGSRVTRETEGIVPTKPDAVRQTLATHKAAFLDRGVDSAWQRTAAVVVQPGLEFGATQIDRFNVNSPDDLSAILSDWPGIAFEAHSTDYQYPEVFPELARRHFTFLKVGPALTFAYREALYALDAVRQWYMPTAEALTQVMERLMKANPEIWKAHFQTDGEDLRQLLHFSYSDRIRYLWPQPAARSAVNVLLDSLEKIVPMPSLLHQHFSAEVITRAEALTCRGMTWPHAYLTAEIHAALAPYMF